MVNSPTPYMTSLCVLCGNLVRDSKDELKEGNKLKGNFTKFDLKALDCREFYEF